MEKRKPLPPKSQHDRSGMKCGQALDDHPPSDVDSPSAALDICEIPMIETSEGFRIHLKPSATIDYITEYLFVPLRNQGCSAPLALPIISSRLTTVE